MSTNDPRSEANQHAQQAAEALLQAAGVESIDLACTLGSGWGEAAGQLGEQIAEISAEDLPGFHISGVPGHSGSLKVIRTQAGLAGPKHVLVIGARTHYYEGHGVEAVAHGVRTAAAAGAGVVVLTNGCGGLNPSWSPGTPVLIRDHLNLTGTSPLQGAHFVDLTDLYSLRIRGIAQRVDPSLGEGVYAQLPGPHYETPAEISYLRTIGADLVGMSTALEAIAARAAGMEVFGISLVTNLAAGISDEPLSHQEVIEAGAAAAPRIASLLAQIITTTLEES
ncbi:purine-nucleoside phosphorylase [Nesterenkonia alkaliphila]|uniref:Purine nucleoside phosphorylase n=1 Tax=Nesterenkonia alkaliphila TaxID=1463631 RepID=A0A7K1UEE0_9MICC|nr:purine-nucleoside phosphorylase [Nesterenkonia alkaliphila]MVT24857.1 purine-nucleoside phosphorylase [Nesterenkonia alkaliphila]GFZ92761.1 purine nucleoside phosphorylase [Nesterenkonia alkaliphila]